MGSRKKTRSEITAKQKFIRWYYSLTPNDRIAFKAFWWHWGRSRVNLKDMLSIQRFWKYGPLTLADMIRSGYGWMHLHFGQKRGCY